MKNKKLGLIVNPVAGMGGKVGLKGTDGLSIVERARALGAQPESPWRTVLALERIKHIKDDIELITYPNEMGEEQARNCGFIPTVIGSIMTGKTTSFDTKKAARELLELNVDLLLFAGGDGTARDIYESVGGNMPVLGIPCGVKMHSAVYATSPQNAGDLVASFLETDPQKFPRHMAEVMDIDENAFRNNRVSAKLYGYLQIPYERRLVQNPKAGSVHDEATSTNSICLDVVENMQDDVLYIIGPGTTTRSIAEKLGLNKTLLGVDIVYQKNIIGIDVNETQILDVIEGRKAKIIVTVIGGQGYVFGRGNQQISAKVIETVGYNNILVVATKNKIFSLQGNPLLVDTGDNSVNKALSGYIKVITGFNERLAVKIEY